MPAPRPAGLRRFLVEVTAFGVLSIAVPLAVEITLRVFDVRTERPVFEPALADDGTPIFRLAWNPQAAMPQPPQPQREFAAVKLPGTFRIFVIGASPAEGVPYGTSLPFAPVCARRLAAQAADGHWEVVHAALGGLQSWGALAIVREIARHQPDLLVVYLGHNDIGTRFSPSERAWLDPRGFA